MRPKAPNHKRMKPSGKSPTHLDLIRQLPCLLSGRPAEAAHIRYADAKHGKAETGVGRKPDDRWTVPLCPELHRLLKGCQHDSDERAWWQQFGVDPLDVAGRLWGRSRLNMERVITMRQPWDEKTKAKIRAILKGESK
jgi:hypothetical protein